MAAVMLRCQNPSCGREFVSSRSHARWCSERCRKAYARRPDLPENLAMLALDAADGDCWLALDAAIAIARRFEAGP